VRRLLLRRYKIVSHIHGTAESFARTAKVGHLEGINARLFNGEETYLLATIVVGKSFTQLAGYAFHFYFYLLDCTGTTRSGLRWLKQFQPEDSAKTDALKDSYNHNVTYTCIAVTMPELVVSTIKPVGLESEDPVVHEKGLQGLYCWAPDAERERCLLRVTRHENNSSKEVLFQANT